VPEADTRLGTPVLILLIWLAGASGCLLVYLGSKLTFLLDDWEFLLYRRGFDADTILDPHGEHIVAAPILIYKALLATVGMGSALPFRIVSTALFLLSAILLFAYLKDAVGQWLALAATAIVLFLGAAWEDLLWSFQIVYFGSVAAGLGALLALRRGGRRSDPIATALLVVSMLFSSLGLSFAIGAAVEVMLRPDRWRRLYIFAVPLAVYALWWLGWGHTAESNLSIINMGKTPLYVLNGFASSIASASGLANHAVIGGNRLVWVRPIAVALIFLAAWRLHRLGRVPAWFWVTLAVGGSFWILAGLNQMPGREPDASRYQYLGVVFLFLVAGELLRAERERGLRLNYRPLAAAVAVVVAASLISNVQNLVSAWDHTYRPISQLEKADLGALEIAEGTVEPAFVLSEDLADTGFVHVEADRYLSAVEAFGSPAYDPAEIAESPSFARFAADKVLFGALRMGLAPVLGKPEAGCVEVPSDGIASTLLTVPPGRITLEAGAKPIDEIRLARFATGEFPILIEGLVPGEAAELVIPRDRAAAPWKLQLETAGTAIVCGLSGGGGA
jgi:hypothetical protein